MICTCCEQIPSMHKNDMTRDASKLAVFYIFVIEIEFEARSSLSKDLPKYRCSEF